MSSGGRDDFSASTKTALALRASYRCSLPECRRATVGPSDEGPSASASIGVAAHIRAAAPGGRRYDPAMSASDRADIANGIWLCADHATLIDRDTTRYTAEYLHQIKDEHETWCFHQLDGSENSSATKVDLVAIGPNIVGYGSIVTIDQG